MDQPQQHQLAVSAAAAAGAAPSSSTQQQQQRFVDCNLACIVQQHE
jgi:hypothetical protein